MTVLLQCLGCGVIVKNPKAMNYIYEKCDICSRVQREREELAIDTFLHDQAERKHNA